MPNGEDYGYDDRRPATGRVRIPETPPDRVDAPSRKESRDTSRQAQQGVLREIRDHQSPPVTRVKIGKLGDGLQDYGLEVYDASGTLILGATGLGIDTVDTAELVDGAVTTPKLGDGAVTFAKHAANLEPVDIVSSLPDPAGYSGPKTVLLTTDSKLYRYDGSVPEWTVAVPTADLTGEIAETQISDGAISTPKLAANAVTAAKVAAGTITANEIAADTIVAGNIASGAIQTSELDADAVTAAKIAAGAVVAGKIDAGAIDATNLFVDGVVEAAKINVSQLSAISADVGVLTAGRLEDSGGTFGVLLSGSVPAGWTRWLNLVDSGNPFLKHEKVSLAWDGSATFSGEISASSLSFVSGEVRFTSEATLGNPKASINELRVRVEQTTITNPNYVDHTAGSLDWYFDGSFVASIQRRSGEVHLDDGSTNTARLAAVVISSSAPSGDYPDGTIWIQT